MELLREYKLVCKKVKKEVQKCKKRWNDNLMSKLESDRRKSDYRSIYKMIDKMSTPEYKASTVAIRKDIHSKLVDNEKEVLDLWKSHFDNLLNPITPQEVQATSYPRRMDIDEDDMLEEEVVEL